MQNLSFDYYSNLSQLSFNKKVSFLIFISKGFLKQIEVKIIGKNELRFDRTSVIIKLKSEDKILHTYKYKTKK